MVLSMLMGFFMQQLAHAEVPVTIVVSDLHFGLGHAVDRSNNCSNEMTPIEDSEEPKAKESNPKNLMSISETALWNPFEDFRWASDWQLFLDWMDSEYKHGVTLVFAGDTFELWQSSECDCRYPSKDAGCTEAEAIVRLERVLSAHAEELGAIKEFAAKGNTVIFIPGNHDAALTLPRVKAALLAVTGTTNIDVVSEDGYWFGAGGKVYVEHGHQIGHDVNRIEEWPMPVTQVGDSTYLRRSWGELFVQEFYNDHERRFPIVDNIVNEATGVKYAYSALGPREAAAHIGDFFRFFLFGVSWPQFKGSMGADKMDEALWDYARTRKLGDNFLVELLPAEDPMRSVARASIHSPGIGLHITDLTEEELRYLCDRRGEENKVLDAMGLSKLQGCVSFEGMGAIGDKFRARDQLMENRFKEIIKKGGPSGYLTYVYGHTHQAEKPWNVRMPQWTVTVINTGAWQRTIGAEQINEVMRECAISEELVLEIQPEDLPNCYNFVSITPGQEGSPELHNWNKTRGGGWDVGSGPCAERAFIPDCLNN